MAFSSDTEGGFTEPNVVPLVDVMLVLLIIFMVTASVSQSIQVELPKATIDARTGAMEVPPVTISVRENGDLFWNEEQILDRELMESRLSVEAQKVPQPKVLLRADGETKYALIQEVTTKVRLAGMRSINFVSEPES